MPKKVKTKTTTAAGTTSATTGPNSSPSTRTTTTTRATTRQLWMTASSSSSSFSEQEDGSSSSSSSAEPFLSAVAAVKPIPRPDEPNLFELPSDLHPNYRALPWPVMLGVILGSTAVSALSTWKKLDALVVLLLTAREAGNLASEQWKKLFWFLVKSVVLMTVTTAVLQEIFWRPSRLSIHTLMEKYFLPSKLSKYEIMTIPRVDPKEPNTFLHQGIHFLEYPSSSSSTSSLTSSFNPFRKEHPYDAIVLNHGFGASCLSWLPALPRLVDRLKARVGLSHDAPGFGFSERPPSIADYTPASSAQTGITLLKSRLCNNNNTKSGDNKSTAPTPASLVLMGHSMGAITTLRMASSLSDDPDFDLQQKRIILVAPALGLSRVGRRRAQGDVDNENAQMINDSARMFAPRRRLHRPVAVAARVPSLVLHWCVEYALRRLVGQRTFWRDGLRLAWGDPSRLTESDVLRFQWPSIGAGWEQGLVAFSRAQLRLVDVCDATLLQQALDRGWAVDVIVTTHDRVVPMTQVRQFLQQFPQVRVVEMAGLGHDPFEEDVDGFVNVVEQLLQQPLQQSLIGTEL